MTSSSSPSLSPDQPQVELRNVAKSYLTQGFGRSQVFSNLSFSIPKGFNVGVIGRNGAGKSTLMRLIGGMERPDRGSVFVNGTPSPPQGLSGGVIPILTARDNAKFVCRVFGLRGTDMHDRLAAIEDIAGLGRFFDRPVNTYSSGMRARLNFALNMAFEYDLYLFDELGAVGDKRYRERASQLMDERKSSASFLIVGHSLGLLKRDCDAGLYLRDGAATFFPDINDAIACYENDTQTPS